MTAAAFLQIVNQLVYLAVTVAVIVEATKRLRRTSIDTALFFTALALILELSGLSSQLGIVLPSLVTLGLAALLLVLPYIQLRLLDDFVGVGPWTKRAAVAGLVAAIGSMILVPSPMPGVLTLAIVFYFVTVLGYCAVRFLRESRRARGLVAARLLAVAVGSGLLSLVLAIAVILPFILRGGADVTRLVTQLVILAAGISYFLGFAPPSVVKRLWQESALRQFMQEVNRLPEASGVDEIMRRLEIAAGTATAGSRAVIAVWDEANALLQFTTLDGTAHTVDTRTTDTLSGRVVQERRPILSEDPARDYPRGAELYRRIGVKAIVGAPIVVRGQVFGVLAVHSNHPSLFGRDDTEFLGLLADQIGIAVENSQLLAEVRRLTAEERRLGEAARSRLATIVESSPDAIVGSTLDGIVTDWNPAAERMYGYPADEIVGKNIAGIVPADRAAEATHLTERIRAGLVVEQFETERVRKDGTRIHVSLGLAPLRGAGGVIEGVATVARDITEGVAAKRREADLEARLRQSERLESVGLLAGGIAHDFNNLLAVVMNYATFIEDKLPDDDAELKDDLAQIRHAAERGAVFTRQLLTFAHQRPVNVADLQLNELIPGLQQMLHRSIPESIAIELRLAPDLWMVRADAGQLEQLLLNLVMNAGDAMPDGGTLLIETANARYDETSAAQLSGLVSGPYVRLTVTDTGHGMSKDVLAHAFEPFFTTKPTGKGTGLGLATVYGITKQAGGHVSIYSEIGRGTSIRALLPAQIYATRRVLPLLVDPPNEAERADVMILLVEDEPAVRTAAARILRADGYGVVEASSPAAAIELAGPGARIDLLVTDMVMPGMSGRDLSRSLRANRPDLGVVYMSGYSEDLVIRDSKLDGPLVQKPFTRDSLLLIVRVAARARVRTRGSPVPTA